MEIVILSSKSLCFSKPSPLLSNVHLLNLSPAYRILPKPILFAEWKRRRSRSRKSHPISLESLAFLASHLRVLPEPLDFVIREFAGGNGGGRFGLGRGGSHGWGRWGERRLGFWVILVVSGLLLSCVLPDGGKGRDLAWAAPILLTMVVYCLGGWWKRANRGLLLGFCCGASMVGLGLLNGNLVRLNQKFRANIRSSNPIKAMLGKAMRRRR